MCGLAGYNGKKPNLNKINVLSIINEDRGTDASGIYYNDFLKKNLKPIDTYYVILPLRILLM